MNYVIENTTTAHCPSHRWIADGDFVVCKLCGVLDEASKQEKAWQEEEERKEGIRHLHVEALRWEYFESGLTITEATAKAWSEVYG